MTENIIDKPTIPESFHVIIAVWGDKYVNLFLNVTLPTHLSEGNLPEFVKLGTEKTVYHICSLESDIPVIETSEVFKRLKRFAETRIHRIDDIVNDPGNCKYLSMTKAQEIGLVAAIRERGAAIIIGPHGVLADGSLTRIKEVALSGKRVFMWASFRAEAEIVSDKLIRGWYSDTDCSLTISSRDLVKIGYDHMHLAIKYHFWDSDCFMNDGPATLLWDLKDTGLLMRCAHMGPMMVFPDSDRELFGNNTLDGGDYVYRAFKNFDDIYVVQDSDDAFCLTLSFKDFFPYEVTRQKADISRILSWYRNPDVISPYHLKFLGHRLFFHFNDVKDSIEGTVRQSDKVVQTIVFGTESDLIFTELNETKKLNSEMRERVESLTISNSGLRRQRRKLILDGVNTCLELYQELMRNNKFERAEHALEQAVDLLTPLITTYRSADDDTLSLYARILGLFRDKKKQAGFLKAVENQYESKPAGPAWQNIIQSFAR